MPSIHQVDMQGQDDAILEAMAMRGKVTAEDLRAELNRLEGKPMQSSERQSRVPVRLHQGRANVLAEVQSEETNVFLSFRDRENGNVVTVRIDAASVSAVTSMLTLAADRGVDSKCYVDGGVEVARA